MPCLHGQRETGESKVSLLLLLTMIITIIKQIFHTYITLSSALDKTCLCAAKERHTYKMAVFLRLTYCACVRLLLFLLLRLCHLRSR